MEKCLQLIFKVWWILRFVRVPVSDKFRPLARLPENSGDGVKVVVARGKIIITIMF